MPHHFQQVAAPQMRNSPSGSTNPLGPQCSQGLLGSALHQSYLVRRRLPQSAKLDKLCSNIALSPCRICENGAPAAIDEPVRELVLATSTDTGIDRKVALLSI